MHCLQTTPCRCQLIQNYWLAIFFCYVTALFTISFFSVSLSHIKPIVAAIIDAIIIAIFELLIMSGLS
ncbi:MAG TPA: hypothetical protein DFH96_06500 [Bacteroidetes bacterium]|nr:hypothetical protein [Bacteroidota bacterium]